MISNRWKFAVRWLPIIGSFVVAAHRAACRSQSGLYTLAIFAAFCSSAQAQNWFYVTNDVSYLPPVALSAQAGEVRLTVVALQAGGGATPAGTSQWVIVAGDGFAVQTVTGTNIATSTHRFRATLSAGSYSALATVYPSGQPSFAISRTTLTITNAGPSLVVNASSSNTVSVGPVNLTNTTTIGAISVTNTTTIGATTNIIQATIIVTNISNTYFPTSTIAGGGGISNATFGGSVSGSWDTNTSSLSITGLSYAIAAGTGISVRAATTNAGVVTIIVDNSFSGAPTYVGGVNSANYTNKVVFSVIAGSSIDQQWTVPAGVTQALFKAWGGGGGGAYNTSGGNGGFSFLAYAVVPNQTFIIRVGQGGVYAGAGGNPGGGSANITYCGGGGGYSCVMTTTNGVSPTNSASITNFVLIAGGGGGSGNQNGQGGIGGGLTGGNGTGNYTAGGGTQSAGGAGYGGGTANGSFLTGGTGIQVGGGGGYYGGGANGGYTVGSGGGGSGYIRNSSGYTVGGNNSNDPDWASGIGAGGGTQASGNAGRVVVLYNQ